MIDASVWAAFITAVAAIISAIYAAIITSRNSKHLARLQSELDRQKEMTLEYIRASINLEVEDRKQTFAAFIDFIRLVQLLREQLSHIVKHPDAYKHNSENRKLAKLLEDIKDCYAGSQALFDDHGKYSDRSFIHSLKNNCGEAEDLVQKYLKNPGPTNLQNIKELLASVTKKQAELRIRARSCSAQLVEGLKAHIEKGDLGDAT